jgi:hypothetical protein
MAAFLPERLGERMERMLESAGRNDMQVCRAGAPV